MKKSLLAIVFAAATLPLTFAQTPAPNQPASDQKSTAAPTKAKKTPKPAKHSTTKKTSATKAGDSTTSTPQK
jgi:hypothetical protein